MPEERSDRRRVITVKYGDRVITLSDRLDILEKRMNVTTAILVILAIDHIGTIPGLISGLFKLLGI